MAKELSLIEVDLQTPVHVLVEMAEEDFREAVARYQRRILSSGSDRLHSRRAARECKRKIIRKRSQELKRQDLEAKERTFNNPIVRPSVLLDSMNPGREKRWKSNYRKQTIINVQDFDFFDHPVETIKKLKDIANLETFARSAEVNFDTAYCDDVAPVILLGLIKKDMAPVMRGGKISGRMAKVMSNLGLDKLARMNIHTKSGSEDVWPFPLVVRASHQKTSTPQMSDQRKDKVAENFVKSVQSWLRSATEDKGEYLQLTDSEYDDAALMILEMLDNAERHAPEDGSLLGVWHFSGFMAKRNRDSESPYFVCHVAIVSLGETIAETIQRSSDATTKVHLNAYLARHNKKRSMDTLATVLAVQPGMTKNKLAGTVGGFGFTNAIKFLNRLGGSSDAEIQPELAIVSGKQLIRIKEPYRGMHPTSKTQWLNDVNSSNEPPSENHALELPVAFPGTIITMRFQMSPEKIDD